MWDDDLDKLMSALGYRFQNVGLLELSLSHRSFAHERAGQAHNERLEFLGDAVLDLCVGRMLMDRLPDAREGRLTKLRSMVVSSAGLDRSARQIQLGRYMLLGRGERQTGGQHKASLLADTLEAVVGAVYQDGGYHQAEALVERLLGPMLEEAVGGELDVDCKGPLQELTQARGLGVPNYQVVETRGPDHQKTFVVAARLGDDEIGRAEGSSKKVGEQRAAEEALARMQEKVE